MLKFLMIPAFALMVGVFTANFAASALYDLLYPPVNPPISGYPYFPTCKFGIQLEKMRFGQNCTILGLLFGGVLGFLVSERALGGRLTIGDFMILIACFAICLGFLVNL